MHGRINNFSLARCQKLTCFVIYLFDVILQESLNADEIVF